MSQRAPESRPHLSVVERRVAKIVDARSVVVGLAVTFLFLALAGAVVMRLVDESDFPSFGLALWWALQTITTVGYGDVVPTTDVGRVVGGVEMVFGVSFIAFVTAGVTSTVIHRIESGSRETERLQQQADTKAIIDALTETRNAISALDQRLERMDPS
jgi:voltage-gated potassium channel Kch